MSDLERAAVLWEQLVDLIDNAGDGTITRAIAADFAAVRLEERRALRRVLEDAHDALGELMGNPQVATDWDGLAAFLGNESWVGLKQRIDDALGEARS